MKKLTLIIILMIGIYADTLQGQEPDSSNNTIQIGKNLRFRLELCQFGMKAIASLDGNTMAEVQPIFLTGFTFALIYVKNNVGLNISPLFYTEGEKIYPLATFGFSFNMYKFGVGWNFGKITGQLNEQWKERLCVVFSVNPFK